MSDGKSVLMKSDVVILSIKPHRPEFSPDRRYIPVKVALQEWDKLDAYYRGQILKLKNKVVKSTKISSFESGKKSDKPRENHQNNEKSSSSIPRRRSTSTTVHQIIELFGDENISTINVDDSHHGACNEENKQPHVQHRSRSKSRKRRSEHNHDGNNKETNKSEKVNKSSKSHKEKNKKADEQEEDDNFLSVPRNNFVIQYAIGEKKRTQVHRPDLPGFINPVKVEPYKPPVAIGFNVVHIQKILHYSSGIVQHTPPITTIATTPEKPPNIQPASPTLLSNSSSNNNSNTKTGNNNKSSSSSSNGQQKGNTKETTTTSFIKPTTTTNFDDGSTQGNAITSTSLPMKRKSEHHNNNNATTIETLNSPPNNKKVAVDKESWLREKMPPPRFIPPRHYNRHAISITDKIIQKGKELPPELKDRERRRNLECRKRRAYAQKKNEEQSKQDSVDVSLKALEMIWNIPLLSPIRSP